MPKNLVPNHFEKNGIYVEAKTGLLNLKDERSPST